MRVHTLAAATTLAVLFSSAVLTTAPAVADTTASLPVKQTADIVVDGVHQRVFVSDPSNGKIVVTDYAGKVVRQLTNLPNVVGLELSADSGTLYAAVAGADAIVAFDTATGTETTRYTVGDSPLSVALAGGKLWFSHGGATEGNIGSVDFSGEQPVVTLAQEGGGVWYLAPMLDAAPGSSTLIAASIGGSPVSMASYDVSSGTLTRTVYTNGTGGNLGDIQVTPDSQHVIVASGAPYYHQVLKTSDLTEDGSYASDSGPNAVAIAPNGAVAAGVHGPYEPDVYVYKPGSTRSIREYDFPDTDSSTTGADELAASGLAWAPDGSRLFAVTSNYSGVYSLRVLEAPTTPATSITVDAPATATRAKQLTVKGKVSSRVALPAGIKLTVTRTDLESPSGKALATVTVKADGTYSFVDTPPVGGKVKYTLKYAGDAGHASGTGSDTVEVSRAATTLTLNNNGKVYAYGADVTFTAHLGTTYKNRKVEIWANPYGSDKPNTLVKSGTVNSSGNLSVVLDLKRDTKVTAKFLGDARYVPKTLTSTVGAEVKVSTSVSGHYKTSYTSGHTYYYFKKTKNPLFTNTMTAYPGRKQRLQFEIYYNGTWYGNGSKYFTLSSAGVSKVELTGEHETGWRMRVRSSYVNDSSGDTVNSTTYGAWKYFTFTS
ncbi:MULTISPECIES: Ig-like domain repeat protein [unclassified Streptomyces]|uniref:Ig-like domain repeat protein n=1 Tax=unclassified Streptomyces TaxID=2593676 RepID=UPI00225ADAB3|nr:MULTISPECIES: Ig-like domain repeat protein [unclassified Streptomyces]MCX4989216.1 Ig-like domain repeat protein [Streptomyces sp. NBC_00568]MCX5005563.1 Ig-like domain repeat protein [Streptomyces sp. NBC_00638]